MNLSASPRPGSREEGKMEGKLDEEELKLIRRAAWTIFSVLPWEGSKKGGEYWDGVFKELVRIADTGEP